MVRTRGRCSTSAVHASSRPSLSSVRRCPHPRRATSPALSGTTRSKRATAAQSSGTRASHCGGHHAVKCRADTGCRRISPPPPPPHACRWDMHAAPWPMLADAHRRHHLNPHHSPRPVSYACALFHAPDVLSQCPARRVCCWPARAISAPLRITSRDYFRLISRTPRARAAASDPLFVLERASLFICTVTREHDRSHVRYIYLF